MSWTTPIYAAMTLLGFALLFWARLSLPETTVMAPVPPLRRVTVGPYHFMRHPMYVGTWLMIVGFAGFAAGFWNVIAVGMVAELLFIEWAWRERGLRRH